MMKLTLRFLHVNTRMHAARARRGSVVIIVIWAIAIAAVVASSVQLFSYRQAALGRDALIRIQARWAARAGIESWPMTGTVETRRDVNRIAARKRFNFRIVGITYRGRLTRSNQFAS